MQSDELARHEPARPLKASAAVVSAAGVEDVIDGFRRQVRAREELAGIGAGDLAVRRERRAVDAEDAEEGLEELDLFEAKEDVPGLAGHPMVPTHAVAVTPWERHVGVSARRRCQRHHGVGTDHFFFRHLVRQIPNFHSN